MAYKWCGMQVIPWEQVKRLHLNGGLAGLFRLYSDNTEGVIEQGYSWDEIVRDYEAGVEFGVEKKKHILRLGDGKEITVYGDVNVMELEDLDSLGYELWDVIKQYMEHFGIEVVESDEPDWSTVKEVQSKIIDVIKNAGVNFEY